MSALEFQRATLDSLHERLKRIRHAGCYLSPHEAEALVALLRERDGLHYWTVVIPFVPGRLATEWHPTESEGPFSVLTRGAFKTPEEALAWGRDNLGGMPYSLREVMP